MPFDFMPNSAQYEGADWSNFIKTVPGCTPEAAQRIARADPGISFFFYCRQPMLLKGQPPFNPGDAVFFSGEPWPGSAPQADIYQKSFFSTAYVEVNTDSFANVGCFTLQDGRQLFDFACIFAANIDADANSNAVLYFNPQVSAVLNSSGAVKTLQSLGISVLLSVLNNHKPTGWSEFADEASAQKFVGQLGDAVARYGLDGIDIDDEYSSGTPNLTSLAMVTTLMRQAMPDKIVSKALFADSQYFGPTWEGHTLAGNLTCGWEMTYGSDYSQLMQPYLDAGMDRSRLALGVKPGVSDGAAAAAFVKQNGFGLMVYPVASGSTGFLSTISNPLFGENTTAKPGCLS